MLMPDPDKPPTAPPKEHMGVVGMKQMTEPDEMDRGDIEMLFRCLMQFARHLAKKYGFTIKQWPEK